MRLWQKEEDEGWPVVRRRQQWVVVVRIATVDGRRRQQQVVMVRTVTTDGRRQQAPRRLGQLLWQRPTIVAGRHGRKATLEDKGRWVVNSDEGGRQQWHLGATGDSDRGLVGGEEEAAADGRGEDSDDRWEEEAAAGPARAAAAE
ncbi:hypothetical protein BHE74_00013667 [Ensete ventricosum]|nr:hypothetical protein BHE74_00013667 [Ensete ventricosum]RZS11638.1 hypothetical protein BHM03_00042991 [Ensete ventricosum]